MKGGDFLDRLIDKYLQGFIEGKWLLVRSKVFKEVL
jgi:hypothetical protein